MYNILVVAGDPGGASALIPVIDLMMHNTGFQVYMCAYNQAYDMWSEKYEYVQNIIESKDDSFIRDVFEKSKIDLLLTGTSCNEQMFESRFIFEAKKRCIPTVSLLDFWSSYKNRFFLNSESEGYLPDKIAVMDELCLNQMVSEGFDRERIAITGQPAFDLIKSDLINYSTQKKKLIFERYNISDDDFVISFVSQPFTELYENDKIKFPDVGFDEIEVLNLVIDEIKNLSEKSGLNTKLVICPHPREEASKFENFLSKNIHIFRRDDPLFKSCSVSSKDIIMSSDLVIGMNSILLIEACYLNKITISFQPQLSSKDSLPTNNLGYTVPAYSRENFQRVIWKYAIDQNGREEHMAKLCELSKNYSSAENVINLINSQIKIKRS